eukprot:3186736-Prymnesium_polylepis.1
MHGGKDAEHTRREPDPRATYDRIVRDKAARREWWMTSSVEIILDFAALARRKRTGWAPRAG